MRLILLGAPGSGKGTQAELLKEKYGCAHISTGDILRQNLRDKTELGLKADSYMSQGALVPDTLVVEMVGYRLQENDVKQGFLLDGFPRTVPQAEALENLLSELGWKLDAVLLLKVDEELIVRRLTLRRTCRACGKISNLAVLKNPDASECPACGGELYQRDDDKEAVIRNRLKVYDELTAPLVSWYGSKGLLSTIEASQSPEETFEAIRSVLSR